MCSVTFGAQLLQSERPVWIQHRLRQTRICSKHSLTHKHCKTDSLWQEICAKAIQQLTHQQQIQPIINRSDNNEQYTVVRGAGSAQLLAPAAQIEGRTEQSGLCQNEERAEDAVAAVCLVVGRGKAYQD
eukprot:TRINITY_DN5414_c0_g1_i3.p2 TRINITY_DN5414_c0_g1~~TRINITY_DN5414_c0_g1_i3.p2  ORF type:complete len:151 (+),score=28.13 TRINITY_DN5414_c0_g1_i3:69-455(+)